MHKQDSRGLAQGQGKGWVFQLAFCLSARQVIDRTSGCKLGKYENVTMSYVKVPWVVQHIYEVGCQCTETRFYSIDTA